MAKFNIMEVKMNHKIEKRIEELKKENDELNRKLIELEQEKRNLINLALINNGRILELETFLNKNIKDNDK